MKIELLEHLELVRTLRHMHDIEPDPLMKLRIKDAARDLVAVVLPHTEAYIASVVENDSATVVEDDS